MRRRFIGNDMTRAMKRQASVSSLGENSVLPRLKSVHRGSSAGLKNAKPAYLQHAQGGYANPAHQIARRFGKPNATIAIRNTPTAISTHKTTAKLLDMRFDKGNNSISLLRKLL